MVGGELALWELLVHISSFISRGADREMTLLALLVRVLSVFYVWERWHCVRYWCKSRLYFTCGRSERWHCVRYLMHIFVCISRVVAGEVSTVCCYWGAYIWSLFHIRTDTEVALLALLVHISSVVHVLVGGEVTLCTLFVHISSVFHV